MTEEFLDTYNKFNNSNPLKKMRSEAHKKGLWHRVIHVWIYNSKGKILLQLRSKEKPTCPNVWDISVAGHITAGNEPLDSALREVREEIGLKIKKQDLDFFKIQKGELRYKPTIDNEFYYIYFLKFDGDIKKLKLQKEEVERIKFFTPKEIRKNLKEHPKRYVQYNYWQEAIAEIERRIKRMK